MRLAKAESTFAPFDFVCLGDRLLHNIRGPLDAYEAVWGFHQVFKALDPLVGYLRS